MKQRKIEFATNQQMSFPMALVAGIYKQGLTAEEREKFLVALEPEISRNAEVSCQLFAGNNICAVGVGFVGICDLEGEAHSTGGSFLSICPNQTSLMGGWDRLKGRLNGAWSLIVVNEREGVLLGRDPFGAQSMYYFKKGSALIFGSSLTLFRNLGLEVDRKAVADFLHFLYIPAPRTIYREVQSVLPGQFVCFSGKDVISDEMHKADTGENNEFKSREIDDDQNLSLYEKYLQGSMRRCCPEGRKVALFLSGGKDSSALAVAARNSGLKNIEAITLGFAEQEIDESGDARRVAEWLKIPLKILKFPRKTYLYHWPEFIRSLGQPNGDCAALPVFVALRVLADSYDVFLDGTGNDSYFGIPATWLEELAWRIHRICPGLHHFPWKIFPNGGSYSVEFLFRILSKPREEQFVSWNGWTFLEIQKLMGLSPAWQESCLYSLYGGSATPMEHKTATLCRIWEPETAYRKVIQLANTIRKTVRYPFLDQELVTCSHNLLPRLKYSDRINKIIIRQLLNKYLPQEIVMKKKGSFIFPKEYILATNNYECINIYLSKECISRHDLVDATPVSSYIDKYRKGDITVEDRLWSLTLLHAWAEQCRG